MEFGEKNLFVQALGHTFKACIWPRLSKIQYKVLSSKRLKKWKQQSDNQEISELGDFSLAPLASNYHYRNADLQIIILIKQVIWPER